MSYSPVYPDLMILGFFGFFWCKLSTEQLHSSNRAGGQTLWSGRYFLEVSCSWFLARSTNEKLAEAKERRSCCARNPRREQVLSMSSQVLHSDIQGGSRHAAAQPLASTTSTCWSTSARCQFQLRDVRVISAISQCFWKIEKQWSTGDKQSLNIAPATQHPRRSQKYTSVTSGGKADRSTCKRDSSDVQRVVFAMEPLYRALKEFALDKNKVTEQNPAKNKLSSWSQSRRLYIWNTPCHQRCVMTDWNFGF